MSSALPFFLSLFLTSLISSSVFNSVACPEILVLLNAFYMFFCYYSSSLTLPFPFILSIFFIYFNNKNYN